MLHEERPGPSSKARIRVGDHATQCLTYVVPWCMATVSKRDLNQRTAEVLAQVTESADLVVTERGRPRWRVSAYHAQESSLERLAREERFTPPSSNPTPWSPSGVAYSDAEVDALLDDVRGED